MEFGPRLKILLDREDVSQTAFANKADLHKGLVSRVLNGEKPSSQFIYKTLQYFEKPDFDFLFGDIIEDRVEEPAESYESLNTPEELISQIELRLKKLKKLLPQ